MYPVLVTKSIVCPSLRCIICSIGDFRVFFNKRFKQATHSTPSVQRHTIDGTTGIIVSVATLSHICVHVTITVSWVSSRDFTIRP